MASPPQSDQQGAAVAVDGVDDRVGRRLLGGAALRFEAPVEQDDPQRPAVLRLQAEQGWSG